MLILLWGLQTEAPLRAVSAELNRMQIPTVFVDQRDVLATEADLSAGLEVSGWLRTPRMTVDFDAITAAYLRPYDSRTLPCVQQADSNGSAAAHALAIDDLLFSWADITPADVVNRPSSMAVNNSKPYQLQLIRNLGFAVPETLVTTDAQAVEEFWAQHGKIIYKSISSTRSRISCLQPKDRQRLRQICWCPTQFQQYIAGVDYRVHVVGSEVFACELVCAADDYRYPGPHAVEMRSCSLPVEVAERCLVLARSMQLHFAGVDLRRTPEGQWYCFEVNPSPAFTYYQEPTGQPIANAVARLLTAGAQCDTGTEQSGQITHTGTAQSEAAADRADSHVVNA